MKDLTLAPLTWAGLATWAALPGHAHALPHLRWCLGTAYAHVLCARAGGALVGVGTVVVHSGTGWIGHLHVRPAHQGRGVGTALLHVLLQVLEQHGAAAQRMCAPPALQAWLGRAGFRPEGELVRVGCGTFEEATRTEVVDLAPHHLLALLHLDRRATGEDRRPYLIEHTYLAQAYIEQGRLRGALFPLHGHGYVVADAPAVAQELLRWLLPLYAHVLVPVDNTPVLDGLLRHGHRAQAHLLRLVRGAATPWRPALIGAGGDLLS